MNTISVLTISTATNPVPMRPNPANAAANDRELLEKFAAIGFETAPASPEALAQRSRTETAKWAKVIQLAGVKAD